MNRILQRTVVLLSLLTTVVSAWADDSYYDTVDYVATVHDNNVWEITETSYVVFTEPHHGVTRWLRKRYNMTFPKTRFGLDIENVRTFRSEVSFNESSFMVDGEHTSAYQISDKDDDISIRIGDQYTTLTGEHVYSYQYTTVIPDDGVTDIDLITKTIVPRMMEAPTKTLNVTLKFDKALPETAADKMKVICGGYQHPDTDRASEFTVVDSHTITGTLHDIPAYYAVTLRLELPQGYFNTVPDEPTDHITTLFFLLTAALAIYIIIRGLLIRPQIVTKQIEFYPPDKLNSAEVGVIIDDAVNDEDIASMIPWFASEGYITIKQIKAEEEESEASKTELVIKRVKPLPDDAPKYQRCFMEALFDEQDTDEINLKDIKYSEKMEQAKDDLFNLYKNEKKLTNSGYSDLLAFLLLTLGFCTLLTNCYELELLSMDTFWSAVIYTLAFLIPGGIGWLLMSVNASDATESKSSKLTWSIIKFVIMIIEVGVLIFFINDFYSVEITILTFVISMVAIEFLDKFHTSTPLRMQYLGKLLGLKEFIETAEKPRLEQLINDDAQYFYKILPYAMALGVASKWGEKFKDIPLNNPQWMENETDNYLTYNNFNFIDNLTKTSNNAISQAITKPEPEHDSWDDHSSYDSSSSFSYSGSSGGGHGDGGGGFW